MEKLLHNQSKFAHLHGVKRQRIGQLVKAGDLMIQKVGRRTYIIDNQFNRDCILERCMGTGHWNRPRDTPNK
jgi:hypothetical protein